MAEVISEADLQALRDLIDEWHRAHPDKLNIAPGLAECARWALAEIRRLRAAEADGKGSESDGATV